MAVSVPVRVARSYVRIGCVELLFGCAGVACGAVAKSKLPGPVEAAIGLWAAYFVVLGVLVVLAGFFKVSRIHCISLIGQIIGLIMAAIGFIIAAIFWTFLNTCSSTLVPGAPVLSDFCACGVVGDVTGYDVSCSDVRTVRNITAAAVFVYLVLEVTSLFGLIYACAGICCISKEPRTVTVTTVSSPSQPAEAKPMMKTASKPKEKEKGGKKEKKTAIVTIDGPSSEAASRPMIMGRLFSSKSKENDGKKEQKATKSSSKDETRSTAKTSLFSSKSKEKEDVKKARAKK